MKYVTTSTSQTLEVKKSKFITYIFPYSKFDETMKFLKDEHPKGRHFVYAYRYINEFDQIVENSSDDGEPKGTSGKPSLNVLSGADIVNSGVIIVRYFGGIKLGTGGLVKAYSDAVNLALDNATTKEFVKLEKKSLKVTYSQLSQIEYMIDSYEIEIESKEFTQDVTLILSGSKEEFEKLNKDLFRDCELVDEG